MNMLLFYLPVVALANGEALSFLSRYDVFTLLNNALSNAIEAVEKVDNPKMKIIYLVIAKKHPFATIEIENYYSGQLRFDSQGDLESSKEDNRLHGLGIKSMKRILETYDGQMTISAENNIFDLRIVIPLRNDEIHDGN